MKWSKQFIFLVLLAAFSCDEPQKSIARLALHDQWEFRQVGSDQWRSAEVPGVVHTDLLQHALIPHPWKGTNEKDVQWIEEESWEYRTFFNLTPAHVAREGADLLFEGLDTYAEVRLNDQLILSSNNMFREWRVDVNDVMTAGRNELLIEFRSPIVVNTPKLNALGYELPAGSETAANKVSPFTRKAPYHFGWDWGPRLVTAGIWRPIHLELYDVARIADVQIIQHLLSDTLARMEAIVTIEAVSSDHLTVAVWDQDLEVEVQKGHQEIRIPFEIADPQKWWPNGWGESHLHAVPISLAFNGALLDADTISVGLRTVELVRDEDRIGESFYFKINDEPLFARGANYIPQSHFLPSVRREDYQRLIQDAKQSGMNMLRVWGGGIYENDVFYDLCDANGILIWQDFMFAGSMYPGDKEFVSNVMAEVEDNVKRLRNHPSIIHWNGNNEMEVAWQNWGWQKTYGYSSADSTKIWNDYLHLFHDRIRSLLNRLDDRPYTTTSPLSNWGTPANFNSGSMHYWGVWHGTDDFEDYRYNVGRFMSEYGFQSFPDMETIRYFSDSAEWQLDAEVMQHHQKSYVGNGMIAKQIPKYFEQPVDFEDFVKKSQQTQAKAMQLAIDAHRLKKGHNWGSLFWQLNDCWPGPSWSAVDVFGRKKNFYQELSTLFAPVALIPAWEGDTLVITLVNDTLENVEGTMHLQLKNKDGEEQLVEVLVSCKSNGIEEVYREVLGSGYSGEVRLLIDGKIVFQRSS